MTMVAADPDAASLAGLLAEDGAAPAIVPKHAALLMGRDGAIVWANERGRDLDAWLSPAARARLNALESSGRTNQWLERLAGGSRLRVQTVTCICRNVMLAAGGQGLLVTTAESLPARPAPRVSSAPAVTQPEFASAESNVAAEATHVSEPAAAIEAEDDLLTAAAEASQEAAPALTPVASETSPTDIEPLAEAVAEQAEPEPEPTADAKALPASFVELTNTRPRLRFVWESDAAGRFTRVSPDLAKVVGAERGDIVGKNWADLDDTVMDADGRIAAAFATRETWSGARALWRVAGSRFAVPVELAAVPVKSADGGFAGYRGFGVCDLRNVTELATAEADTAYAQPENENIAENQQNAAKEAQAEHSAVRDEPPNEMSLGTPVADEAASAVEPEAPLAGDQAEDEPESQAAPALVEVNSADTAAASATDETKGAEEPAIEAHDTAPAAQAETAKNASPVAPPAEPPADQAEPQSTPEPAASAPQARVAAAPRRLSVSERGAFREIARALGAKFIDEPAEQLAADEPEKSAASPAEKAKAEPATPPVETVAFEAAEPVVQSQPEAEVVPLAMHAAKDGDKKDGASADAFRLLADKLPFGIVVNRGDDIVYVNRAMLDLTGYQSQASFAEAGLERLFARARQDTDEADPSVALIDATGRTIQSEVRLSAIEWDSRPATLMVFRRAVEPEAERRIKALELDLASRERQEAELTAILDTATDGVVLLDERGRILSLNRSAEALFGYDQNEVTGESFGVLLAPDSHAVAFDYLEGLKSSGVASLLNDGREVIGRVRQGGRCPLFMTMGRVGEDGDKPKFCAVLRDMSSWKKAETELLEAKQAAERASAQKSDFLARISHEIRTPLNAIIGFAEVIMEERFGPVGNERYKEYLRDIHASGGHVISLINDLLDLAKIEAGRMELEFGRVQLNEVVGQCVSLMQPQANRERIVLRMGLAQNLPPIVADERSIRQIVLNILSNAVKFTEAGGQVIVSTTLTDRGDVTLRIRDTGIGMTEQELQAALEPFRQLNTTRRSGGTGLGLPLTKALVEANRGALTITSDKNEGTLVEIVMPRTRVLAE
jgi:PAS domain S-box-containing protein